MIHIFIIISILSISEIHIIHRICNGDLFGDMANHMFGFLWKWGILCVDDTFGWPPTSYDLVGALEHVFFPFSWECHHPNWRTPSFFRGVGIPPTSDCWFIKPMNAIIQRPMELSSNLAIVSGASKNIRKYMELHRKDSFLHVYLTLW